ncbi:MAG: Hpt domain-containing protein [Deltaproteobacteria bacterium]|jgi:two-component system sensor histidine kinase/response regulator
MPAPGIIDIERIESLRSIGDGNLSGLIEELTTLFRDTRAEYIGAVEAAIAAKDAEAVGIAIHTFKASSRSLGALRVVQRCAQIEEAAREGDLDRAERLLADLGPVIGEATEALFSLAASGELDG